MYHVTTLNTEAKLTARETEILTYISHGYSTKQIAASLFISEYTVDNHRKNMLKKMGAKTSAELVLKMLSNNLY